MILALQTTTFSAHGGIPSYNRLVCRALNEIDGTGTTIEKKVLIAADCEADLAVPRDELTGLTIEVFGGNRLRFTARAFAIALRHRIDVLLIGHANYAPIGLLLRCLRPGLKYGVIAYGIDAWSQLSVLKRRALQRADFVASISEYTKAKLVEVQGVAPERVHVL